MWQPMDHLSLWLRMMGEACRRRHVHHPFDELELAGIVFISPVELWLIESISTFKRREREGLAN